jgi:hypothetical protein
LAGYIYRAKKAISKIIKGWNQVFFLRFSIAIIQPQVKKKFAKKKKNIFQQNLFFEFSIFRP